VFRQRARYFTSISRGCPSSALVPPASLGPGDTSDCAAGADCPCWGSCAPWQPLDHGQVDR
jgi:hypothetical protein